MPKKNISDVKAKKVAAKKVVTPKNMVTKKVSPKPSKAPVKTVRVQKRAQVRGLVCASEDECFWTTDGQVLSNLEDLALALGSMDETVFFYHANEDKNDFAEWVEHVLNDAACADGLRVSMTKKKAAATAKKHLKRFA